MAVVCLGEERRNCIAARREYGVSYYRRVYACDELEHVLNYTIGRSTYAELHRVYWTWLTYRVPQRFVARLRCISLGVHGCAYEITRVTSFD